MYIADLALAPTRSRPWLSSTGKRWKGPSPAAVGRTKFPTSPRQRPPPSFLSRRHWSCGRLKQPIRWVVPRFRGPRLMYCVRPAAAGRGCRHRSKSRWATRSARTLAGFGSTTAPSRIDWPGHSSHARSRPELTSTSPAARTARRPRPDIICWPTSWPTSRSTTPAVTPAQRARSSERPTTRPRPTPRLSPTGSRRRPANGDRVAALRRATTTEPDAPIRRMAFTRKDLANGAVLDAIRSDGVALPGYRIDTTKLTPEARSRLLQVLRADIKFSAKEAQLSELEAEVAADRAAGRTPTAAQPGPPNAAAASAPATTIPATRPEAARNPLPSTSRPATASAATAIYEESETFDLPMPTRAPVGAGRPASNPTGSPATSAAPRTPAPATSSASPPAAATHASPTPRSTPRPAQGLATTSSGAASPVRTAGTPATPAAQTPGRPGAGEAAVPATTSASPPPAAVPVAQPPDPSTPDPATSGAGRTVSIRIRVVQHPNDRPLVQQ